MKGGHAFKRLRSLAPLACGTVCNVRSREVASGVSVSQSTESLLRSTCNDSRASCENFAAPRYAPVELWSECYLGLEGLGDGTNSDVGRAQLVPGGH